MGKTVIHILIFTPDEEWDRYEKRHSAPTQLVSSSPLDIINATIEDALVNELGLITKTKILKIE